jgi:hypothetical protein
MFPRVLTCERCGETAIVTRLQRIEYDEPPDFSVAVRLNVRSLKLTVYCPSCGAGSQDYRPPPQEQFVSTVERHGSDGS